MTVTKQMGFHVLWELLFQWTLEKAVPGIQWELSAALYGPGEVCPHVVRDPWCCLCFSLLNIARVCSLHGTVAFKKVEHLMQKQVGKADLSEHKNNPAAVPGPFPWLPGPDPTGLGCAGRPGCMWSGIPAPVGACLGTRWVQPCSSQSIRSLKCNGISCALINVFLLMLLQGKIFVFCFSV